jgi:predicted 2-oxoglutarate/Fe(II)-dependent dioxygenase YbiX
MQVSSYSPMPNQFFREFCQPDLNTNPIYGLIHKAIDSDTRLNFLEEIEEKKQPIQAKTKSGAKGIRQVDAWRLPIESYIGTQLNYIILDLNETFNYRLSCIQDIQYLEYKEGDYYDWHSDVSDGLSSLRKISMSYVLNDDFKGGDLEFFHGGETYVINAKEESLIAFTSFINHRVKKVTQGVRKALVVWVNGESWR